MGKISLILLMAFLHVPGATGLVTMKKSPLHVLTRGGLFLQAGQSGGAINFPAGIIDDGLRFQALGNSSFRFNLLMAGGPSSNWGRRSFTIRHWWRAASFPSLPTGYNSYLADWRIAFSASTFSLQHTRNQRLTGVGIQFVDIPTLKFRVYDGATVLGLAEYQFTQSPNAGSTFASYPPGGIVGPLIEMSEDTWHRTIAWYDEDALEIGLQLDNLTPEIVALSGPIPAGATQGLLGGETTPVSIPHFDYTIDEYGLWHNYVWTSAERLADWNSGAGTGWPDVLTAVSRRPMAYWRFEEPEDYAAEGVVSMSD